MKTAENQGQLDYLFWYPSCHNFCGVNVNQEYDVESDEIEEK